MRVIHFTHGATDPLWNPASGARQVALADGYGVTHVSCLHLEPRARIPEAPTGAATALLPVYGYGVLWTHHPHEMRLNISPGAGYIFEAGCRYSLESRTAMICLLVESTTLEATDAGISTPERIMGQLWPGERAADLRESRSLLGRCIGDLEWPVRRFVRGVFWRMRLRRKEPGEIFQWESLPPNWRISAAGVRPDNTRTSQRREPGSSHDCAVEPPIGQSGIGPN